MVASSQECTDAALAHPDIEAAAPVAGASPDHGAF
jgi:hypothetical protein